jgi:hypothetical protein
MGLITSTGMVVTSSERKGRPRQAQPGNREWATVIQAIGAEGYALPPYLIVVERLTFVHGMKIALFHQIGGLQSRKMAGLPTREV